MKPATIHKHHHKSHLTKTIAVDVDRQILIAYENGIQMYKFDCTTGDGEHKTHLGVFKIYRKDVKHFSKKYNAQMDFAMFFNGGEAIHMSHAVGITSYLKLAGMNYFGSHGCVRLTESEGKALFEWTPMGTPVRVFQKE